MRVGQLKKASASDADADDWSKIDDISRRDKRNFIFLEEGDGERMGEMGEEDEL